MGNEPQVYQMQSGRSNHYAIAPDPRIFCFCDLIAPTPDTTHASDGVIIFVRQSLSFFKLSASSLSLLDPYFDYVGVNKSPVSLKSLCPFIRSSTDSRIDSFPPPEILHSGKFQLSSPFLGLKSYFRSPWGKSTDMQLKT